MKASRLISRSVRASSLYKATYKPSSFRLPPQRTSRCSLYTFGRRTFSSTPSVHKGLQPDTSDPKPPAVESSVNEGSPNLEAAQLEDSEYHELADQYLNTLVQSLEDMADQDPGKGLEVEYAAGVLTITLPKKGDYVLNKQPPNKQIWLSSPISGPKRYDWVLSASSGTGALASQQHEKQDSEGATGNVGDDGILGGGRWIYLRDGSSLTQVMADEVGVTMAYDKMQDEAVSSPGTKPATGATQVEG